MHSPIQHAAEHVPHALHSSDRAWPETNCYLDLWIELLHAAGRDPLPLLGLGAALDWEVDHFTFLKPAATDLLDLAGVTLHELALWDDTEAQVVAQIEAGAVVILEVDAFFLPDTRENAYRCKHSKTTIAITAIDRIGRCIKYIHNSGRFRLDGDDYDGALLRCAHRSALFPYAELVRFAAAAPLLERSRAKARQRLLDFARTRSPGNPIDRFADALPGLIERVGTDAERINALCFNTTRQLGAAFELLSDHIFWLGEDGSPAASLAEQAKALQFRIARAARRARPDPAIAVALQAMARTWQSCSCIISSGLHQLSERSAA